MVKILGEMFESNPEKSTIVINGKCSSCGRETTIEITTTSGGFGLLGGTIFKCSPNGYLMKCPSCYQDSPRIFSPKGSNKPFVYQLSEIAHGRVHLASR